MLLEAVVGGGAFVESGYIVKPRDTYDIVVGKGGGGGKYIKSTNPRVEASPGGDGEDTVFKKSGGAVIFQAGGGEGGKTITHNQCINGNPTTADGGNGGITHVISGNKNVNIVHEMSGEKGHMITMNRGDCNGGASPQGGLGGKMCKVGIPQIPGGGGAGAAQGAGSYCWKAPDIDGQDGTEGKIVIYW